MVRTLFAGFSACLLLLVQFLPGEAWGQTSRGVVSPIVAQRYGLNRAWFTQVNVDRARGRVIDLRQHVSAHRGYTIVYAVGGEEQVGFSERELDTFGDPVGVEGARKRATEQLKVFRGRGIDPHLKEVVVPEISLFVTTDRGMVHSIDGESGRTRWSVTLGNPDFPTTAADANDAYVAVLNGSDLYLLDQTNGALIWKKRCTGVPGAGPAISEELVFVPTVSGMIESFSLGDPKAPSHRFHSTGRAVTQPQITANSVAWPTDRGYMYVGQPNRRGIRFRLQTNDAIVARPAFAPPNRLFAASLDGYVYCLHEFSGAVVWRFSTGEPISQTPAVVGDMLYVVTDDGGMFQIDRESGLEQWWTPGVRQLVSASASKLYVISDSGRLMVLDAASGSRLAELPVDRLDMIYTNLQTDRLFVGTSTGMLQCLHEFEHELPLVHLHAEQAAAPPQVEVQQGGPAGQPAQPARPPAGDPFGGGNDDPFGGAADPFGGGNAPPAGGAADPFGVEGDDPPAAGGGADPFGGGADPFGGAADPFGG